MSEDEKDKENKSDDSDDELILEESPCGRWSKRSEEVSQRNVPGIDKAYLAMDSEEGVEVVWNEVQFSERKIFKQQEEKIKAIFDNLMRIDHANIVKFHRYWIEEKQNSRVVFITEYMSSGSVKEFLNKTKELHMHKRTKSWKRWCTQILSALSYLHNCNPPVIHGNMTCDTIFIQHNGLVKIGSVAPDAIRNHVKTYHEVKRHMHYYAPEYEENQDITPAVDIYSFGICALEMAVPRSHLQQGELKTKNLTPADIERGIESLENPQQKDFIRLCLRKDPAERPSARQLLLHPLLFEVHSLKLLAAHAFVKNQRILPEYKHAEQNKDMIIAQSTKTKKFLKDIPLLDVNKLLEDVMNGVYPLTSYALPKPPGDDSQSDSQQSEGQSVEGHKPTGGLEEIAPETRKIVFAQGTISSTEQSLELTLQLRFEDKMNRHLNCILSPEESGEMLATELVDHKFIKETDKTLITQLIGDLLNNHLTTKGTVHLAKGQFNSEQFDVPTEIISAFNPVQQAPLGGGGYMFYPNVQNTVLQKSQPTPNGSDDPNVTQINATHQLPILQPMPAGQSTSVIATQGNATPLISTNVLQHPQVSQTFAKQIENSMATGNLATQLASQPVPTVLPVPLQYMQVFQPPNPPNSAQTSVHPAPAMFQMQLQQQMLQPIYASQPLIQTPLLTPINQTVVPAVVQQPAAGMVPNVFRPRLQQPALYQQPALSSNNSNNAAFSRSTSRVDEQSSTSVVNFDLDLSLANKSPPTSVSKEVSFKAV